MDVTKAYLFTASLNVLFELAPKHLGPLLTTYVWTAQGREETQTGEQLERPSSPDVISDPPPPQANLNPMASQAVNSANSQCGFS